MHDSDWLKPLDGLISAVKKWCMRDFLENAIS